MTQQTVLTDDGRSMIRISDIKYGSRFRKDFGNIIELVQSIKINALLCPVGVTKDGLLIHGARRIRAYTSAFPEAEYIPCYVIYIPIKENGEIDENLTRKAFNVEELLAIKRYRESIEPNLQGKRTDLAQLPGKFPRSSERRDERIAKDTGYSYKSLTKLEQIEEAAKASPESFDKLLDKIDRGMKIDKAWKLVQNHRKREQLRAQAPSKLPNEARLILGDCREQMQLKTLHENSIELIFTDPPYDKASLSLYIELAKLASRVLKPGGSLLTYAPHYALPEVFDYLIENSGLTYWWIIAMIHSGAARRMHKQRLWVGWKPILWFVKGDKTNAPNDISDIIKSQPVDKSLHEWEQSTVEADHCIRHLTIENDIVLDPFMGSGTTGLAAINLKRQFIGIEINPEDFELARANITKRHCLDSSQVV